MPQNGTKNLIPFNQRTEKEQQEIRRKGGIKSGEARRRKKNLKETMQMILDLRVANPIFKEAMDNGKVKKSEQTNQTALLMRLFELAMTSEDLKYLEKIQEIVGQKPNNQQEINLSIEDSTTSKTTSAFMDKLKSRKNSFDDEEQEQEQEQEQEEVIDVE